MIVRVTGENICFHSAECTCTYFAKHSDSPNVLIIVYFIRYQCAYLKLVKYQCSTTYKYQCTHKTVQLLSF